ncbi:MAG: hypothetical protein MK108_06785 [Mariniblastus sp.]|nr:hypothetical protein [Mariniblastus sp.]
MNEQPDNVNRICWRDLCPWTILFRTLPAATSLPVLVFAVLGVVLAPIGWQFSEFVFIDDELRNNQPGLAEITEVNGSPYAGFFREVDDEENTLEAWGARIRGPQAVFQQLVQPFQLMFDSHRSLREFFYVLCGSVWTMLVWSFFGLGIARVCLLRLTRDERSGLDDAFEYSIQKFPTAMLAISLPLLAVFLICLPTFLLGLFLGFDVGSVVIGAVWLIVLLLATVMALLLLGLLFGWPLIISSVACEGQNSFDAMTRGFAYTFQRPLNYLLYTLVAILFGGFCWLIAAQFTEGVVHLGYWSTSWGSNLFAGERIALIEQGPSVDLVQETGGADGGSAAGQPATGADTGEVTESSSLQMGRNLIGFWNGLARTVCVAFLYGLFWCLASAGYLLLRRDVDEMEMDEIHVVDERRTYELPQLKSDESGIPQVQPLDEDPPTDDEGDAGDD